MQRNLFLSTMTEKNIQFTRIIYLRGPNIWTYRSIIEAWVDIGALENFPSNLLPGFTDRLTRWLPSLIEHRCGVGTHGGFIERLHEGTWMAHILEHVVLELQTLAGMPTGFGKTRKADEPSLYKMVFRTEDETVGRSALEIARQLLLAAIHNTAFDLEQSIADLREMIDQFCLGPSTAHIVKAATKRHIPWIRLNHGNLVQLGYGQRQRRIWTAETDQTSAIAEGISSDKDLTKSLLQACGVPVPEGQVVYSAKEAYEAAQYIGIPVAIKPYNGNHGRGVSLNLSTEKDVTDAFYLAYEKGQQNAVIVEKYIVGNEHRVLVIGNKVAAVAAGETAWVVGDGHATIIELIDQQINSDPRRGATETFPLNVLGVEHEEIILELSRQGCTPHTVPQKNERVLIQHNGNVAFDVTDHIHPDIAALATLSARVVGLNIAGVDLVAKDITQPLAAQEGAIIEVNAGPGLLAHIKPANGEARPIGDDIIEHLFPNNISSRIPVIGLLEAKDSTLIAHLVAHFIFISGKQVGLASHRGLYLNQRRFNQHIPSTHMTSSLAEQLLINRNLEAAVIESSYAMILHEGLAYDRCTIGIVSEFPSQHLIDTHADLQACFIDNLEKAHHIIRTQIDVVLPEGVAILNAAHTPLLDLIPLSDGEVVLYTHTPPTEAFRAHRQKNGRVVWLENNCAVLAIGDTTVGRVTLNKSKNIDKTNYSAVLAAISAAWMLKITPELIEAGLKTFEMQ